MGSQVEKTKDFYEKAFKEAEDLVRKLQAEKECGVLEKMQRITSETAKLREELDRFREAYDRKLLKLAATGSPVNIEPMDQNDNPPSTSISAPTTVIDTKARVEISRLKKQRELFLNTKVYNENDDIIK